MDGSDVRATRTNIAIATPDTVAIRKGALNSVGWIQRTSSSESVRPSGEIKVSNATFAEQIKVFRRRCAHEEHVDTVGEDL